MRETVTIPLSKPLRAPNNEMIKQVILREPTFDEYLAYGDPFTVAQSSGGTPFVVENEEIIRRYIALCLVEPKDPALLEQGNARLGRALKQGLLNFFQPDVPEAAASEKSPTNSPSEKASGETASMTSES